jgi:hypothetical protein
MRAKGSPRRLDLQRKYHRILTCRREEDAGHEKTEADQPELPEFRSRCRYPGLRGKVVDWVEHKFEEGLLYLDVRFTDKSELCWRIATRTTIEEADLSNWNYGDFAQPCVFVKEERGGSN